MIHWLWLIPAAALGLIIGVPLLGLATSAQPADLRTRNSVLYGRLYSLVRAVEDYPRAEGDHNRVLDKALNEAREVLGC